jgi:hypothetical protein
MGEFAPETHWSQSDADWLRSIVDACLGKAGKTNRLDTATRRRQMRISLTIGSHPSRAWEPTPDTDLVAKIEQNRTGGN